MLVIAFGTLITYRSAFMLNPKTDFQCYARAGWAVRAGADIYEVTDNNGWHFAYPPAFAIAMIPLADPYPFLPRSGYLPFAVSVGIWYALGVLAITYSTHVLAAVAAPDLVRGSREWWAARVVPVLLCGGTLGHTLGRGQVNAIILALLAAGFASTVRKRNFLGGACLAAAAAVKIIPALFVLFPVVNRDRRGLIGYAAAAVVFLAIVPGLAWGPVCMRDANVKMVKVVLGPVFSQDADQTRSKELHGLTATDNQSVQAAVQAWLHPDRESRPARAEHAATLAHLAIAGCVILFTLSVGYFRAGDDPAGQLVLFGCFAVAMVIATPVSHMHYYAFAFPLVAGLWHRHKSSRTVRAVLLAWAALTCVPLFPGEVFVRLRECGLGMGATLALWVAGISTLIVRRVPDPTHGVVQCGGSIDIGRLSNSAPVSAFTLES